MRLTERVYEQVLIKGLEIFGIGEKNADILENATRKLFEYEYLGLSPEEIKDILVVLSESQDDLKKLQAELDQWKRDSISDKAKLGEYRIEDGLVCNVGDMVYLLLERLDIRKFELYESHCVKYTKDRLSEWWSMWFDCKKIGSTLEYEREEFGKLVFFTREEAEKRLAELEGGAEE